MSQVHFTISDLITHLKNVQKEHGDLPLYKFFPNGSYVPVKTLNQPTFLKILQGRETKQRMWETWHNPELKGLKVLSIFS